MNVVLYGKGGKRWAFTERGRKSVYRSPTTLTLGPSSLHWDGDVLSIRVDEVTAPIPSKIRGTIRLYPGPLTDCDFALDPDGFHRWQPVAPAARIKVDLAQPSLKWEGNAYHDSNRGAAPLEQHFTRWNWSRAHMGDETAILYNVTRRDAGDLHLALRIDSNGQVEEFALPPTVELPNTLWRVPRETRADAGQPVSVLQTLEDSPFYSRSVLSTSLLGRRATAVHEGLCLDRFGAPWVQLMVPFRNPRSWR